MEQIISLTPETQEPRKELVSFVGGSMDGKVKSATISAKMDGVVITLKNQERYKYEEPLTMRFIGMKQESEVLTRDFNWKQKVFQKIVKWFNA